MNCIKDGKYTGDSCFGCKVYAVECEIRDKVYRNRWIPVSERLPDDKKVVLQVTIKRLKDDYTWVQSLLWDYDKWKWWEESDDKVDEIIFEVTAWQPLPEPWKGEEE